MQRGQFELIDRGTRADLSSSRVGKLKSNAGLLCILIFGKGYTCILRRGSRRRPPHIIRTDISTTGKIWLVSIVSIVHVDTHQWMIPRKKSNRWMKDKFHRLRNWIIDYYRHYHHVLRYFMNVSHRLYNPPFHERWYFINLLGRRTKNYGKTTWEKWCCCKLRLLC